MSDDTKITWSSDAVTMLWTGLSPDGNLIAGAHEAHIGEGRRAPGGEIRAIFDGAVRHAARSQGRRKKQCGPISPLI
jgi:hypothetical protein